MKKLILFTLGILLCLWGGAASAYADTLPRASFTHMLISDTTPPNSGNFGSSTPGNGTNTDSNNTDTNTGNNDTNTNTGNSTDSSSTKDNKVFTEYQPSLYGQEKTAEQQIIEDAQQQYGGPRLSALSISGISLIPVFSSEAFSYTAYVPPEQSSVSVYASAASGSVYIDGVAGSARQISLGSEERTVRIIVAEQNSSTTYSISLLRDPQLALQQTTGLPLLTHIQLANEDIYHQQAITTTDGKDITINLPKATGKKLDITLSVNMETLVYCNNVRIYDGLYFPQSDTWQWTKQSVALSPSQTRLTIYLADKESKAVLNTYNLILQQPPGLNIQLQVGNEQALVNTILHTLDAPPVILEGHTMVPLRFIAEAMGAAVSWHSGEKRVEMQLEGKTLNLFIGKITDNMPQAPFISNGYTMVPLRYVSERLNCQVEWLDATREIIITK